MENIQIQKSFVLYFSRIIHRPEMVPEYSATVTGQGKEEDIGDKALLTESLDIFKTQQRLAHENGLKVTIQMTYASLFNDEAVEIAKHDHILFLSLSGHGCRILWNHLRAMDDVYNKFVHLVLPPLDVFYFWTALLRNRLFYGSSITRESHSVNVQF